MPDDNLEMVPAESTLGSPPSTGADDRPLRDLEAAAVRVAPESPTLVTGLPPRDVTSAGARHGRPPAAQGRAGGSKETTKSGLAGDPDLEISVGVGAVGRFAEQPDEDPPALAFIRDRLGAGGKIGHHAVLQVEGEGGLGCATWGTASSGMGRIEHG